MSTDADLDRENVEMAKLNVKVPKPLLDELDDLAAELDHPNRSEYVRAVLRETVEPVFTPEAQERVAEGYADLAAGRTVGHSEVLDRFEVDNAGQQGERSHSDDTDESDSSLDQSASADPKAYVSEFCSELNIVWPTGATANDLIDTMIRTEVPTEEAPVEYAAAALTIASEWMNDQVDSNSEVASEIRDSGKSVSVSTSDFTDITQITEATIENRRKELLEEGVPQGTPHYRVP